MAKENTGLAQRPPKRLLTFGTRIYVELIRFARADRIGGVVSRRFNFRHESRLLNQSLWRFTHMSPRHDTNHSLSDYDLKRKRVILLKDIWYSLEPGLEKESEILSRLNAAGVRNVPALACGDDIEGQLRGHHRFAEEFIDLYPERFTFLEAHTKIPLKEFFIGTLVEKRYDAMWGLNDWDLARIMRQMNENDLESPFYVILYFTLRHMKHGQLDDISREVMLNTTSSLSHKIPTSLPILGLSPNDEIENWMTTTSFLLQPESPLTRIWGVQYIIGWDLGLIQQQRTGVSDMPIEILDDDPAALLQSPR
ncbi:hypothetical protein BYT27DRAFT_7255351 [Phlegmacium glaucopus]|nr:hypothetical protein BYT27DRAFT_7255351 [Phlegmacium glaucopus]